MLTSLLKNAAALKYKLETGKKPSNLYFQNVVSLAECHCKIDILCTSSFSDEVPASFLTHKILKLPQCRKYIKARKRQYCSHVVSRANGSDKISKN
jgi:hypothetical protein